jgi:hypothetical protein
VINAALSLKITPVSSLIAVNVPKSPPLHLICPSSLILPNSSLLVLY